MVHRRFILAGGLAVLSSGMVRAQTRVPQQALAPAGKRPTFQLEEVARFDHQATGVAATGEGRVFVNFPRWTEDSPISVAEVARDGTLKPYPDAAWNSWRNAGGSAPSPRDHFVCVDVVALPDAGGQVLVVMKSYVGLTRS